MRYSLTKVRETTSFSFFLTIAAVLLVVWLVVLPLKSYGTEPYPPLSEDQDSPLALGIRFYQKILSPVLASECYMEPSCSNYSKQAFSQYGPLLSLLLTIDRLFREADEDKTSPLIRQGKAYKLYDPPSANVWWK
jgi:putative component of membrane protein insertase Oxa1/YidC/SpoIIIJ protein YidD